MREDLPSVTALLVALARAAAAAHPMTRPPLRDDVTRTLLPAPLAWLLPAAGGPLARPAPGESAGWLVQTALRAASAGLVDQLALRTAAIDAVVDEARRRGVEQVVILGAGLDARAHRLASLAGAHVFEVDHPASQRAKLRALDRSRRRSGPNSPADRLDPGLATPAYVALDLVRGGLGEALAAAGHDEQAATCWVAEGLTMYLPRETTRATLAAVGARSAPGSVATITYMRTGPVVLPDPLLRLVSAAVGLVGEPLRGAIEPDELASELTAAGFTVTGDTNSVDWARRFDGSTLAPALFRSERLVVGAVAARTAAR